LLRRFAPRNDVVDGSVIDMANQYEPISLSGDDQEIIFRRSRASYLSTLCICAFAVLWFVLSVSYWICRSKIDQFLPRFVGVDFVKNTENLLNLLFGLGPFMIALLPLVFKQISDPAVLVLNQNGVKYGTRARSQEISWRDIVRINVYDQASDHDSPLPDTIDVEGHGYRILIRSQFEIPTRELVQCLNTMWERNTDSNFVQSRSTDFGLYDDPQTNRERAEIENLMFRLFLGTMILVIIGLFVAIIGYRLISLRS